MALASGSLLAAIPGTTVFASWCIGTVKLLQRSRRLNCDKYHGGEITERHIKGFGLPAHVVVSWEHIDYAGIRYMTIKGVRLPVQVFIKAGVHSWWMDYPDIPGGIDYLQDRLGERFTKSGITPPDFPEPPDEGTVMFIIGSLLLACAATVLGEITFNVGFPEISGLLRSPKSSIPMMLSLLLPIGMFFKNSTARWAGFTYGALLVVAIPATTAASSRAFEQIKDNALLIVVLLGLSLTAFALDEYLQRSRSG